MRTSNNFLRSERNYQSSVRFPLGSSSVLNEIINATEKNLIGLIRKVLKEVL